MNIIRMFQIIGTNLIFSNEFELIQKEDRNWDKFKDTDINDYGGI